jgi:hypothetical protein
MFISRLVIVPAILASFALVVGCTSTVTSTADPVPSPIETDGGTSDAGNKVIKKGPSTTEPEPIAPTAECPSGLFAKAACQTCFETKCKAECGSCGDDNACNTALTCLNGCSTDACFDACLDGLSTSSLSLLSDVLGKSGCVETKCATECAVTPPPPPPPPALKRTGDACSTGSQCESGSCNGKWCSEYCVNNTDCGINSSGALVWCVPNNGGTNTCFPGCSTNSDCYGFAGTTCQSVTAKNGASTRVCSI